MIVFGAALHGGNDPETPTAIGAAYDPETDSWRKLPDSELSPQASTAAWNGSELIAWDYLNDSAAYDPATDTWRPLPRIPLHEYECSPESVGVDGFVLGDYCGLLTLYEPVEDAWSDITRADLEGWELELMPAPPAFVLLAQHSSDTSITRMFSYRPRSSDLSSLVKPTPFVPG